MVIIAPPPNSHEKLKKAKVGQVEVGSNIDNYLCVVSDTLPWV